MEGSPQGGWPGWEHESKEASLAERREQRDKQEVRRGLGEGRDGKGCMPMQALPSMCTGPSAFTLVREEALEVLRKRCDVMDFHQTGH